MEHSQTTAVLTYRVDVVSKRNGAADTHEYAIKWNVDGLESVRLTRLYFLHGTLSASEVERLTADLLVDPVTETAVIHTLDRSNGEIVLAPDVHTIDITFLPGVTDPPADNLLRAAHLLGIHGLRRAATGQGYVLGGRLSPDTLQRLANQVLANPVIQRTAINRPITPPFVPYQAADDTVEFLPIRELEDDELLSLSQERRLALDLREMQAIRDYYRTEGRDPSDVEMEMLAQTWSEHCVHKTFKAVIDYRGPVGANSLEPAQEQQIDGLLNTYIRAATEKVNKPWVRSAFVDNAGIIAFDEQFDLAFKVETHNHPSALEPFGGANTGVGGVVRDVLGVSARPIANTDILCFGPPDLAAEALPTGTLHPQRIAQGVIHGIEDYGNKMGIPTVNGAIYYHPGYTANPLVYCGCVGIIPRNSHPTAVQDGDLIVAIGGRTGRDGLRGATFSSMEMDTTTSEIAGSAVQIGNPIQEKQVLEVILRARDERLYSAITDCGAGGFSSAVGEMAADLGAYVQLANATLKYPGLRPWEIWLSEAQERMVLAVPPANLGRLQAICAGQDVEFIVLGNFAASGRIHIQYGDRTIGDLDVKFLHDGLPRRRLRAEWGVGSDEWRVESEESSPSVPQSPNLPISNLQSPISNLLLSLLGHPNIRSKEAVIRRYDHEVQGGTAVKPLVGVDGSGPGDAAVIVPLDTMLVNSRGEATGNHSVEPTTISSQLPRPFVNQGVAISNGVCPQYGELDPYVMAWAAVDEAFRNAVAVGADPDQIALLDNFCWGNPNLPDRLGALVRCAQGCYDAAIAYEAPFVSGKDSLNNEYTGGDGRKHAIPGTLLISALGIVPDAEKTLTMDLKRSGDFLFIVGETRPELGGSHYQLVDGEVRPQHQMPPRPVEAPLVRLRALHQAMQAGLVRACHDCSEGGLAVALAEMCLAGGLGVEVKLSALPDDPYYAYAADDALLFAETLGRFLVEVAPEDAEAFSALMGDVAHNCIGVIGGDMLRISGRFTQEQPLVVLPVATLREAWGAGEASPPTPPLPAADVRRQPTTAAIQQRPRVLILHANGTNRDREASLACQLAGGEPEIVHINQLLAEERNLLDYHMLVLPGGFSYGDDLGAGVLWASELRHRLGDTLQRFVAGGRPVLGICNGFQALIKAGILPGAETTLASGRATTLTFNAAGQFECRWVSLRPNPASPSLFTQGMEEWIDCPVAHGEGRLVTADDQMLALLQAQGLIALTYAVPAAGPPYPANPNGSALNIAGLCNPAGNVLGLMPHPEDHVFSWQHPCHHRGERGRSGLQLFINGIRAA